MQPPLKAGDFAAPLSQVAVESPFAPTAVGLSMPREVAWKAMRPEERIIRCVGMCACYGRSTTFCSGVGCCCFEVH